MKQCSCGEDIIGEAGFDDERVQLGAESRAARGGSGAESRCEGVGVGGESLLVHGLEEAARCGMRAGGDVRGEEGVPGGGVRTGDLVEHLARGDEAERDERVGGEELVPGRWGGEAGLEKGGVGFGDGGDGEVVAAAAEVGRGHFCSALAFFGWGILSLTPDYFAL